MDYHSAGAAVRTNWLLGDVFILLSEQESRMQSRRLTVRDKSSMLVVAPKGGKSRVNYVTKISPWLFRLLAAKSWC